jgi:hypothetical protein
MCLIQFLHKEKIIFLNSISALVFVKCAAFTANLDKFSFCKVFLVLQHRDGFNITLHHPVPRHLLLGVTDVLYFMEHYFQHSLKPRTFPNSCFKVPTACFDSHVHLRVLKLLFIGENAVLTRSH